MAQYTVTLSDTEDKILAWLTARLNAAKESNVTPAQFIQSQIPGLFRPHIAAFDEAREAALVAAFRAADESTRAEAETTLGRKS